MTVPPLTDYAPEPPEALPDFNRARLAEFPGGGGGYFVVDDQRVTAEVYDSFRDQWQALYYRWCLFVTMAGWSHDRYLRDQHVQLLRWHEAELRRLRRTYVDNEPAAVS